MLRAGSLFDRYGITRAADVTGLDRIGILVALAVRPNSRSVSVSQGKGVESRSARASAVIESIETRHAERMRAPACFGSTLEMRAEGLAVADTGELAHGGQDSEHAAQLAGKLVADRGADLRQTLGRTEPVEPHHQRILEGTRNRSAHRKP